MKFPTQGIRYVDLSEEEKREWERKFYDPATGAILNEIDSGAINQWLFNQDTVDKVLQSLMESGQKVEGGDKLGKTIIFARNHKHAEFIYERFYKLYPHKKRGVAQTKNEFAMIIDNYATDAESTIEDFKIKAKFPQIAISVDMLDTGIDVPEILNLVFFKPVYSASKFWQMLGRGTRLCQDVFAPDQHKKDFYVFDVCGTFEYFGQNPQGVIPQKSLSITANTFILRCELVFILHAKNNLQPDSEDFKLAKSLCEMLQKQVLALDITGFEVRMHLRQVEHYSKTSTWSSIKQKDIQELREHIASLIQSEEHNELVKQFDLMMVRTKLAVIRNDSSKASYIEKIKTFASDLLRKADEVPSIAEKKPTLQMVLQSEYWASVTIPSLEKVRIELRDLNTALDKKTGKTIYYTNFEDQITAPLMVEDFQGSYGNYESHYEKLKKIVMDNSNNLTIQKLHTNQVITSYELDALDKMLFDQSGIKTHQEFKRAIGDNPLGIFIRSIIGLDKNTANQLFSSFLSNGPLSSEQIGLLNFIIDKFVKNGKIDPAMLYEAPFTKYHVSGINGVFPDNATKIITIIKEINNRALLG